jgi:hypothetical protein
MSPNFAVKYGSQTDWIFTSTYLNLEISGGIDLTMDAFNIREM